MFVPLIIGAIILPFLGFEFGSTINLIDAFKMIPQGLLFEHRLLHRGHHAVLCV